MEYFDDDDESLIAFNNSSEISIVAEDQIVLDEAALMMKIEDLVQNAVALTGTSAVNCRILLHQFRWKSDMLLERICDGQTVSELLRTANVTPSTGDPLLIVSSECSICFDTGNVMKFACGTTICAPCFGTYLDGKIREAGTLFIMCPGYKCKELIEDKDVKKYCSDKEGYKRIITNSYVLANNRLKWCPGADCSRAIEVDWTPNENSTRTVKCTCGKEFCFNCNLQLCHEPVSCYILKKWLKKMADDSETLNWIGCNTKSCPKCRMAIEKNNGCNHMTCQHAGCGFEFCWICYAEWKNHSYECRKYTADPGGKRTQAEADLKKYMFYDNLYRLHKQNIEFNEKLYEKVTNMRNNIMQLGSFSHVELDFLFKAVEALLRCRTFLMYTYAFAYYLKDSNEKTMFENNQIDLEAAVEKLNGFLEKKDLEKEDLASLKQQVQDHSVYLEKRRAALMEHVKQGEQKDIWEFLV